MAERHVLVLSSHVLDRNNGTALPPGVHSPRQSGASGYSLQYNKYVKVSLLVAFVWCGGPTITW